MIPGFVAHLWQSTLFVGVAWFLSLALRKNPAWIRYSVWFIASIKFLIPFSLLIWLGSFVPWREAAPPAETGWTAVAQQVRPLVTIPAAGVEVAVSATRANHGYFVLVALFLWFSGFAAVTICWAVRWRRIAELRLRATPWRIGKVIESTVPILAVSGLVEPGIFGIRRPVLLLPHGIGSRLSGAELEAILAHELCHVRRRDNLTATIHMLVQAAFWFHPLVWWLGERLVDERERACDEEVLRLGNRPQVYAAGILNVCKFYVESPLACVSGVTGANLRERVERILSAQLAVRLSLPKKLTLLGVGLCAITGPIVFGLLDARIARAQTHPDDHPTFEVASIKPSPSDAVGRGVSRSPGARLTTSNGTLKQLITLAYQVMPFQVSGGPDWVASEGFDIEAKAANPKANQEQFRKMIQALLADRFHLKVHVATKEMPIYALVVSRSGSKLVEAKDDTQEVTMRNGRGEMTGIKATMAMFALALTRPLQRKVVDETGLNGAYTFKLQFVPDENPAQSSDATTAPTADGPSIFTALQEQLGLVLKPTKGPVEVLIIDYAEKPTPN